MCLEAVSFGTATICRCLSGASERRSSASRPSPSALCPRLAPCPPSSSSGRARMAVDDALGAQLVNRSSRACTRPRGRRADRAEPTRFAVAALACLAYEIVLTLPDEVRHVWSCVPLGTSPSRSHLLTEPQTPTHVEHKVALPCRALHRSWHARVGPSRLMDNTFADKAMLQGTTIRRDRARAGTWDEHTALVPGLVHLPGRRPPGRPPRR
jgi:hypothetical protein